MHHSQNKSNTTRRSFLKAGSILGLGTSFASVAKALPGIEPIENEKVLSGGNKHITILYTSDIHGQLFTHDEFFWENNKPVYKKRGGMAVLKTMIKTLQKQNQHNILIDGGDYFHGHAVATLTEGRALIPIFNNMNYDVMLPGNWEVVYKKKQMLYDMGHTNAAKICANMWHDTKDENNAELIYPPYWIKNIDGIKLGFIGYTDHLIPKRQSPAYSEGIKFAHAEKNAAKYISYLKETEGCDIIFLVTHMGLAQQVGLANNPAVEGIDFILGADTHERVRVPIEGKYAKVVECGAFGSFVGKLDLYFDNKKLKNFTYNLLDVDPEKYTADKEMTTLVNEAYAPFKNELQKVIGTTTLPLVRYFVLETPMDNLITDAIMWKFKPDIALSNGFRFCQPLAVNTSKGQANITKEFLWNMLPLNSEAKTGFINGQQLIDWLEKELQNAFAKDPSKRFGGWFVRFAGMEVNFTIGNEFGKRVNWIKIKGQNVDLNKEYSVVACEREGDPDDTLCRIEKVQNPKKYSVLLHDVIEDYLKIHSPVAPAQQLRATATDEPQTLLTQLKGTTYEFS
jgi:2',3'-cyclic-nucleotide 2'-phosphodiesterase (5'-nucleotidase family)